jgi:hypothetical protein
MTTEIKWENPAAIANALTTELNALANGARAISSGHIDNGADGEDELYMALELYLAAQGSARDSGAYVDVHLLPTIDGTNYCMGDASVAPPAHTLAFRFGLDAATNARYVTAVDIPIPPFDFKPLVTNGTGQAFAPTGNTLKYRLYSYESQ